MTLQTRDVDNYEESPIAAAEATAAQIGASKVLLVHPTAGLLYAPLTTVIDVAKTQLEPYIVVVASYEIEVGERNEIAFAYNTRGKTYDRFEVTWYDNLRDADDRNDPLSGEDLPTNVSFNPGAPVATTTDRIGFLNFTASQSGSLSPVISMVSDDD